MTATTRPRRQHPLRIGAAITLAAAVTASCSSYDDVDDHPRTLPATAHAPVAPAADQAPAGPAATIELYLVDQRGTQGWHLQPVTRTVPAPTSTTRVIATLLAGPTATERARGLISAIPDGTELLAASPHRDGTLTLELTSRLWATRDPGLRFALGQLACTAGHPVRFEVGGLAAGALDGRGALATGPVTCAAYDALHPPDWPAAGYAEPPAVTT